MLFNVKAEKSPSTKCHASNLEPTGFEAPSPHPGAASPKPRSSLLTLLAVIVLIAFPVRLYLARSAVMLSRDGVTFIWYAQHLAQNPLAEMRRQAQCPLYPALILAAHTSIQAAGNALCPSNHLVRSVLDDPVQSWTLAGMAVSLLGGLTVIWAVYALTSLLFNRRVAILAAVLVALGAEFCQLSADALTDMPHLTLYVLSLYAAIRALRPQSPGLVAPCPPLAEVVTACPPATKVDTACPPLARGGEGGFCRQEPAPRAIPWLFLSGLLSGLAYLMRPEGAGPAVVAVAAVMLLARPWSYKRRLAGVLAVLIGAALVASPYMVITGKLVQKKSLLQFVMPGSCDAPKPAGPPLAVIDPTPILAKSFPADLAKASGQIVEHWCRSLRVMVLLPAVAWIFFRRRVPAQPTALRLVLAAGLLHILILFALILRFDYADLFSIRHTMILAGLTIPFAAAGVAAILDAVPARRRIATGLLLMLILIAPTAPWLFDRRHADSAYLRRAGEWIRSQQPSGAAIHTTQHPVAFYANGICQWSPLDTDIPRMFSEARANRPDWLVFDLQRMLRMSPSFLVDFERAAQPGELERVPDTPSQQSKGRLQRAIIYRYHPPA